MKTKNHLINVLIIIVLSFSSCKNMPESQRPNITGKLNEVVVVIDRAQWESELGEVIRSNFQKVQVGLPQPEPMFDLINIPLAGFNNVFKLHRNIIIIDIAKAHREPKIIVEKDKWARSQIVFTAQGPNEKIFTDYFRKNVNKIIHQIDKTEIERTVTQYKRVEERGIGVKLKEKHKISLSIPKGYKLDVDEPDFVWISYAQPDQDQGILIYDYPYTDPNTFTKEFLVNKRNEVLKNHVKGEKEGTYMTTETQYPVNLKQYYNDKSLYIAELRGLWKLEGGFMGGPFISHTTVDTLRNRIVTVEGYVFSPQTEKRNKVRQLEGILYTLDLVK